MRQIVAKPTLKVLPGGATSLKAQHNKIFKSAYVTDTRLMGVVGLYIHWLLRPEDPTSDLHQFFYLDAEEFGFETYESSYGSDKHRVRRLEKTLFSSLGGTKSDISLRQAAFLIQEYARFNKEHDIPLPAGQNEYGELLQINIRLTPEEKKDLLLKECTDIENIPQLIHYFLMRCFGRDYRAAHFLSACGVDTEIYKDIPLATMCKNSIDFRDNGAYLCETLIEANDRYMRIVSEIYVDDNKISSFEKCSIAYISSAEAAMMLSRSELITVYDSDISPADMLQILDPMFRNNSITSYRTGLMLFIFNKNNDHVKRPVYILSEDIYGLCYLTDSGQLIVVSYREHNIESIECKLRKNMLAPYIAITAKYEFKDPVIYDFIQSGFDDFNDFIEFIRS